ncbi:MAG: RraA family protein [Tropicimonas sp.]|uniref:RraA family protein n=1 Tax=Tropicimonas sp. TaxID=2067044 RepID=UPI003A8A6685
MTQADQVNLAVVREKLYTAVIGDIMDMMGLIHQFLPPAIRALRPEDKLVGRAMPVLEADCATDRVSHDPGEDAFGRMFDALDSLQGDEVYICTGSSPRYALWGELMNARAGTLGAAGAVVDGFHRDTLGILKQKLPLFSHGSYAQDQRVRGRVIDYRCPIEFGNATRVMPGDLIVGDVDGVVVVPAAREAEVIEAALEKVAGENRVFEMILSGRSTRGIFDETGIM